MNIDDIKKNSKKSPLVLIVDDVEENVEILYSMLKDEEYRFAMAFSMQQTYLAVERELPDLILLDVMLPDGNGFEMAREIREKYAEEAIPIIFVTARARTEDKIEGFKAGGVDYITKPFEEKEVLARVRTHVELRKIRKEQEQLIAQLQQALSEVKQLREIIPICASCKKVRDDQGYWIQVEQYLSEHSGSQISHGLCPDCMRELYPEYPMDEDQ
ncbi:MAG TPA: response regulator [Sediminispirochaeta sp.]|nr:response regulator [Sediminispirochaeta sp.]